MNSFRPVLLATMATLLTTTAGAQGLGSVPSQGGTPPPAQSTSPAATQAAPAVQALPQMNVAPPAVNAAPASTATGPSADGPRMPAVSSGLLECRGDMATATGFGSTRRVRCEYRPSMGQNHYYIGTLNRTGLDIGVSDQGSMLWGVLSTSRSLDRGALAGTYVGFTSGFALGPGFSANVLAAQDPSKQVTLQPLSVSSDSGLSLSIAGATLVLEPSTPLVAGDQPPQPAR
ncbi:DUF992 domain-containing protein [Xanthobacter sp. V0B-10]|uniref:DUF992 domain-containing protein n=1 Tax=Xanthobacter albus TaxID=3119929 RepID=UPI00372A6C64